MAITDFIRNTTYGKDKTPKFKPPELNQGTAIKSTYDPSSVKYTPQDYTGKYDAAGGGKQLTSLESALGVQAFDPSSYRSTQNAALQAQTAQSVAAATRNADQNALSSGLGNSGMNRALAQLAQSEGDRTNALGAASIEGQTAQMQQAENARRTGSALGVAGEQLQNSQFGAQFGEGQQQFGANLGERQAEFGADQNMQVQQGNEAQRQANNQMNYGIATDKYAWNDLAPGQRRDQRTGALLNAGTALSGGAIGASGKAGGAVIGAACHIAEAVFGIDNIFTNRARYRVNVSWPSWAKLAYIRHMDRVVSFIRKYPISKIVLKPLFWLIGVGSREMLPTGEVR